jgi:hypothetical protein
MTLEDAVRDALAYGPGNARQITERLEWRVRQVLNRMAEDDKIERNGHPGRGNEKTYSEKPRWTGPVRRLA